MFLILRNIKPGEVINVIFNFKVTFTVWSCINQTLFVVTRWTKDVKWQFFSPHQELELWLLPVGLKRGDRQSAAAFSLLFW